MMNSLYQTVFEARMNQKLGIDLHFHPFDRFDRRVTKIDLGRQSGKTTAILRTMMDNRKFDFILLTHSSHRAVELAEKYKAMFSLFKPIDEHKHRVIITGNTEMQIEKALNQSLRLHSDRSLIIFVEEGMNQTTKILTDLRERLQDRERDFKIIVVGCQ